MSITGRDKNTGDHEYYRSRDKEIMSITGRDKNTGDHAYYR